MPEPARGEVWFADMEPVRGHEQGGRRPVLVISVDPFNRSGAEMAVVLPITSVDKRNPLHVEVFPPEAGLSRASYIKCEDIRSISVNRLERRWGSVPPATLATVETILRRLLGL